ncbi:MBL fold metallo-hydrolase [Arthrobacter zhaoguopingii]|uniref:MBL fold metallo-hydrolase n=1 Tax=Arthrobacter zhaoguopingii TaxID=2681491 RepID=UPI001FEEC450|nr:MBL fold metallo-hydrolase [Arthrobacter zhaoguopingii]
MEAESSSPLARRTALTRSRLAPNPGPMSLEGTNSYLIGPEDSAGAAVVDPGPLDEQHLRALAAGRVQLILITHRHADHTAGAARLHELTGAPVRAADPNHCIEAQPLQDGEVLSVAGTEMRVMATPGHTSDSVCLHLPSDGPAGSVLTGDTILGRGTTMIDHPDGRLGDYLSSLNRLEPLGPATVLPAHGPVLPALDAVVRAYRAHRLDRLAQIRSAITGLGPDAGVREVTDVVYADADPSVRRAAESSVAAQLEYLRTVL